MRDENDEDLIEQYPVQEILVDKFVRYRKHRHLMTAVGIRWLDGNKVIVARLAWPAENTGDAIASANHALANPIEIVDGQILKSGKAH